MKFTETYVPERYRSYMTTYFNFHFYNLKIRLSLIIQFLILSFTISYIYSNECIYILIKPLLSLKQIEYFIVTEITEIFFLQLFVATFFCFVFTFWFALGQLWVFLSLGFYKNENIKSLCFIVFYFISFIFSINLIWTYILPFYFNFFLKNESIQTSSYALQQFFFEPKLSNCLTLTIKSIFFSYLTLQYPVVVLSLYFFNVLTIQCIIKYRKLVYIQMWFLILLLSPPDFVTPILIMLFFILFFELSLYFLFIINNLRKIFF